MAKCDECRRRTADRKSVLGRNLCEECADRNTALAAGLISGGGVGGALATHGWFRWVRARREW